MSTANDRAATGWSLIWSVSKLVSAIGRNAGSAAEAAAARKKTKSTVSQRLGHLQMIEAMKLGYVSLHSSGGGRQSGPVLGPQVQKLASKSGSVALAPRRCDTAAGSLNGRTGSQCNFVMVVYVPTYDRPAVWRRSGIAIAGLPHTATRVVLVVVFVWVSLCPEVLPASLALSLQHMATLLSSAYDVASVYIQ